MITPADGPGPDSSHSERLIALLRRALEGDAGSRNEFFEAIYPEVERITRGILRSRFSDVRQHEETGDVTQQVILKLLTYLSDGLQFLPQTPDQLFSLVRQITRRTLLDLVDKYHGSGARGRSDVLGESAIDDIPGTDRRDLRDARLDLAELVERLPEDDALLIKLRYQEKTELTKIAELFDIDRATARRRIQRIVLELRTAFDPPSEENLPS